MARFRELHRSLQFGSCPDQITLRAIAPSSSFGIDHRLLHPALFGREAGQT